jgi:RTX calcium-binding nonapeptide repeat (4 copies)
MKRRKRQKHGRLLNLLLLGVAALIAASAVLALANVILGVSPPGLGQVQSGNTPATMEPPLCKQYGISPTDILTASAAAGSTTSDLILGANGNNTLNGRGGNDCIVGGAGNDTITGGTGTDVCIGGPGTDTFASCEYCDTTNCARG